jgi:type II secretory pathway pseudopilin PulG
MTLLEITVTVAILSAILLGVMGSLSTGFLAKRANAETMENQFYARKVLEEVQNSSYDTLLSFNGTYVNSTDGKYRANITAGSGGANLTRIEVSCQSIANSKVNCRLVTMVAKLD